VRELENAIERAVVMAEGPVVGVHDLPAELLRAVEEADEAAAALHANGNGKPANGDLVAGGARAARAERDRRERERLVRARAEAGGNKAEAARALGLARSTLVSRLKKHGLS